MPTNSLRLLLAALLLSACSGPLTLNGLYSFNAGSLSAGVLVDGCRVQAGYYDGASGKNDSGEWVICR